MSKAITRRVKRQLKRVVQPAVRRLGPASELPTEPLSTRWGTDRGTPIDQHYLRRFMERHRADITGAVLEIKDRRYTASLGRDVARADVLDIDASNSKANIIADLAAADGVPPDSYDCFVLTETLQYIYDLEAAISHAHRILKPGGVLLATVPCVSPLDQELREAECWRLTRNSFARLLGDAFGDGAVEVETYGNYASCTAWLTGMALEEFDADLLEEVSEVYVQGICARARKALPETGGSRADER